MTAHPTLAAFVAAACIALVRRLYDGLSWAEVAMLGGAAMV